MSLLLFFIMGGYNLGVEPPTIEVLATESGKDYYGSFSVYNRGKVGYYVRVQYYDFGIDSLDGAPSPLPLGTTPYSMSGWLKLEPESLYLPPMKRVKISYRLSPPPDADGSYYGMVLISTTAPGANRFRSGLDIGVNFLLTVGNRPFIKKAELDTLMVHRLSEDIQFSYRVTNIGETHLRIKTFLE